MREIKDRMNDSIKGLSVWAVVGADPDSDEAGYLAYTQVFAEREDARRCLRNSAEDDAECFESEIEWYDKDTDDEWCLILADGRPRVAYYLQKLNIN